MCPAVGGSPQSASLGIDQTDASLVRRRRLPYAVFCRSLAQGSDALHQSADFPISAKQVERITERIGGERVAECDAAVAAYQALPLAEKFAAPAGGYAARRGGGHHRRRLGPRSALVCAAAAWGGGSGGDRRRGLVGRGTRRQSRPLAGAKYKVGLLLTMAGPGVRC